MRDFDEFYRSLGLDPRKSEISRLNCPFQSKMALVSLICFLTYKKRQKERDSNFSCREMIDILLKDQQSTEQMVVELARMCEGFMSFPSNDYLNFNLTSVKQIQNEIKSIMKRETPFSDIDDDLPF